MERDYFKIDKDFFKEVGIEDNNSVTFYVDNENGEDILKVLTNNKNKKRLLIIFDTIMNNKYRDDIYGKENISEKAKNITAMKFINENLRIYCKELYKDGKKIIMIITYKKKTQKIDKKLKTIIETIGGYEYGI